MRGVWNSILAILWILPVVCLCGCGSGAGKNALAASGRKGGKGKLTVTFKWPTPAKAAKYHRFIPLASMSVVVSVNGPTGFTASSPPLTPTGAPGSAASTYTFNSVPTGTITVTSKAFPNPDATGTAQASATNSNVAIQADQTASLTLTMDTTIDNNHTTISGTQTPTRTRTAGYSVNFQDSNGDTVLVAPSTVTWDTDDHTVAVVTSVAPDSLSATVMGVSARFANLKATYQEPGQAAQFPNNPNRVGQLFLVIQPKIYICDRDSNNIVVIDNINGDNRATLPAAGGGYSFTNPEGVAVDSVGGVYVADTGGNRVVRINNPDGSDAVVLTNINGAALTNPTAVAVDNSDNLYILDDGHHRIVQCIYNPNGNTIDFENQWTISTTAFHHALTPLNPGVFDYTEDLTTRANGPSAALVQFDGSSSSAFTSQGVVALRYPWGVVSANGNIYVADRDGNQILQLQGQTSSNATLNFDTITLSSRIDTFGGITLNAPRGLNAGNFGNLYIADTGNHRIIQNNISQNNNTSFGLPDFTTTYTPSGPNALAAPYAVAVDLPVPPRF